MALPSLDVARIGARAADDSKATDIVILNLCGVSDVCDYFMICTASNSRHVDAVVEEIEDAVKKQCGLRPLSVEGRDELRWVLIDFGSVVMHIFRPETREFYCLEELWSSAERVTIEGGSAGLPSS